LSSPIRFDDFELDVSGYQLRRAGKAIKLERIPMELLIWLAVNPGRLVPRGELAGRIWGEGCHFADDCAISTAVRKVRAALADNAEKPRFIETVRGKGYRFIAIIGQGAVERTLPAPNRTILVVLPIENLSEPPRESYLNDGFTEELITCLGTVAPAELGVIGRASAMECQRRGLTVKEIGRALGADLVLEGSVRRQQQRVRISVRLLQASEQVQLWARSYDHDLDDLLSWQCNVARDIVQEVKTAAQPAAPPARQRRAVLSGLPMCTRCAKRLVAGYTTRNRPWNSYRVCPAARKRFARAFGFTGRRLGPDPSPGAVNHADDPGRVAAAPVFQPPLTPPPTPITDKLI
jgi:TolB-like protein